MRIQPSFKKTFKRCGVVTLGYFTKCNANSIPPPPSPHGRFRCIGLLPEHLQCFFIRTPKDPSATLHRFINIFFGLVDQSHRYRWKYPLKISQFTKFESNLTVEN